MKNTVARQTKVRSGVAAFRFDPFLVVFLVSLKNEKIEMSSYTNGEVWKNKRRYLSPEELVPWWFFSRGHPHGWGR